MSFDQLQGEAAGKSARDQPPKQNNEPVNPERWLDAYGDALFSFAVLRVRDRATAQDLVQETFLAALKARQSFAGRSTERAWLFGILRNKLADHYRHQSRELPLLDPEAGMPEEDGFFYTHGAGRDGWVKKIAPKPWARPDESLVTKEFQQVFKDCISGLPEKVGQVILRREVDDVPSDEICKEFGISPNNLWVMLHRGRMALRRCLEVNWFGSKRAD